MFDDLDKVLLRFANLSEQELNAVHEKLEIVNISKNEYLVQDGEIADSIAFIQSGYLRVCFNHDGDEITRDITSVNSFITALTSFITRKPSFEIVKTITDCELMIIKRENLNYLYQTYNNWQTIGRRIVEEMFVRSQKRIYSLLTSSAEDRYKFILEEKPDMLKNIPLQYIASYLGITSQSLSRLRRNVYKQ
ncbi:MAG: Crp/Fnr family transcriptional regulator [Bacteroidales bacterium]|nr:Crp/Fnr family transcriptional regulator [Bacteroidales bacterium]MBN2756066.1 Crp/Fnr family transcriptional regulator [Bacteroidales bacterium]